MNLQSAERTGEKPQGGGRYRPRLPGLQGRPRRQRAEAAAVRDRACSAVGALAQNVRPPSALEGRRSNVLTQVPSSCHLSTPQTRTSALTHLHAFLPSPPSRNRPGGSSAARGLPNPAVPSPPSPPQQGMLLPWVPRGPHDPVFYFPAAPLVKTQM